MHMLFIYYEEMIYLSVPLLKFVFGVIKFPKQFHKQYLHSSQYSLR